MTSYNFGDVILVPFPFTDQTSAKKRPAVVVSSDFYNGSLPDIVLMAITGQIRKPLRDGEIEIAEWQKAGLLKSSVVKPIFTTVEKNLVLRKLGALETIDKESLRDNLQNLIG